jgi:hypothetical protein
VSPRRSGESISAAPPWWAGIPPTEITLPCAGETHRLRWSQGALSATDHEDPDGERALTALGGEPLPCIEMLDAWRAHQHDPAVLVLAPRGPGDLIPPPARDPRSGAGWWSYPSQSRMRRGRAVVYLSSTGPGTSLADPERGVDALTRLLSLGGGLDRRLTAEVAAHWCARLLADDPVAHRLRPRLHAALYGRLLAALSAWLGRSKVMLRLELIEEGVAPSLRWERGPAAVPSPRWDRGPTAAPSPRAQDGAIVASVPFGWLVDVWARGLEVLWGRFCLAANTTDGVTLELLAVTPDLGEASTLRIAPGGK